MDPAWLAIIVTIVIAIIAGLVAHVLHDSKAYERIAKLESRVDNLEDEVKSLRARWHDLRDGTLKDAMKYFEERIVKMVETMLRRNRRPDDES